MLTVESFIRLLRLSTNIPWGPTVCWRQVLRFSRDWGEKRSVLRWGDCREARVGARRVSGRAGVRGHFCEERVNVACFFRVPGPNSNIRAGAWGVSGRFSHYTRPFLGSSRYLRIQLQSDTVYLQVFLDPQAEEGSYTTAFLPQFRHRRQDQSVSADWRCQQPCPAQEATCSSRLSPVLVTHSL